MRIYILFVQLLPFVIDKSLQTAKTTCVVRSLNRAYSPFSEKETLSKIRILMSNISMI